MGENIQLTAADGQSLSAYRADPVGAPKGGIVVVQEIFGVNGHIRDVCDKLAAEGYTAMAPALFDRIRPGIELGYTEEALNEGFGYMQQAGFETTLVDIGAAADVLRQSGKVGLVGFCWGGQLAWLSSKGSDVDCAAAYYGVAVHQTLDPAPKVPVLLHFADNDSFVPADAADQVRAHYPDLPVHSYAANHGFNCDQRPDYDEESAKLAMARTLAFFAEHVG